MNRKQIHLVTTLTLFIMLLGLARPAAPAHAQAPPDYLPGEVIVKLAQVADLTAVAASYALDPTPIDQFGSRTIYRLRIVDGATPPTRAAALAADPRVAFAEPNFIGGAPEGQQRVSWAKGDGDEGVADQWAVNAIRLPEAHAISRGAGVTVAVLDTGVDLSHPALAGRLVPGYDFVDMDADPSEVGAHEAHPVYGHGTHVAGLIALVAPDAKIMPVRVLDSDGVGNIWVIAEALAYAANPDGNVSTDDGADVINLSLSTERQTKLLVEIEEDVTCSDDDGDASGVGDDDNCIGGPDQKGSVVVAAAGNGGSSAPEYPAAEGVAGSLSIGASTATDALAGFSNHGAWVHLLAPGDRILSSVPGGEYGLWSGTSMAAPFVAGGAALVRSAQPGLDAAAVANHIVSKAVAIAGPVPLRIDVAHALGIPPMPTTPISGEYRCTGQVGALYFDSVLVPSGATCEMVNTRIKGTLKIESSATLNATGIRVEGSVQAKGAAATNLSNASVEGSVQIEEGMAARLQTIYVKSDVQVFKNKGNITITGNTIGGNLQCKENTKRPTGSGNLVSGKKEGQCSRL